MTLQWEGKGPCRLMRAALPWSPNWEHDRLPVREDALPGRDRFVDRAVASGVTYTYALHLGSAPVQHLEITIPPRVLRRSQHPQLRVDKHNYVLEVWEGKHFLKAYPIALGADPRKRKLSQDNSTTPEGRYRITGAQPQATYYRAFDLDYPNAADRARYQLLHPTSQIGGEIQIHGKGIGRNWTWGCMAMRNPDIDELFAHSEIGPGTVIWIYGGEATLADIQSDANNPLTPLELGRRQKARGLAVTCLWDVASKIKCNNRPADRSNSPPR